jgi:hypothetical protein
MDSSLGRTSKEPFTEFARSTQSAYRPVQYKDAWVFPEHLNGMQFGSINVPNS